MRLVIGSLLGKVEQFESWMHIIQSIDVGLLLKLGGWVKAS